MPPTNVGYRRYSDFFYLFPSQKRVIFIFTPFHCVLKPLLSLNDAKRANILLVCHELICMFSAVSKLIQR